MNKKDVISIVVSLLLSIIIVCVFPLIFNDNINVAYGYNTNSIIEQTVQGYSKDNITYNKLYNNGKLVGVISDLDNFNNAISEEYKKYEEEFPNTTLGLSDDVYLVPEEGHNIFENKDDEIVNYLIDNELLGIKTNAIEFSTSSGVYDIIYVNDVSDFEEARRLFLLNFISEDSYKKLSLGETITSPEDFESVDVNVSISETITYSESFTSPNNIYSSVDEIYEYLCYGRNTDRQYYTVEEGDTIAGVGSKNNGLTGTQVMLLNQDKIFSADQVITAGMVLNVTYFTSPITVTVTKERLAQEVIMPDAPSYVNDDSMYTDETAIEVEEETGLQNVLYKETWVNGVVQEGEVLSSKVIKNPIQGVIKVGTQIKPNVGTGNYIWPVDNVYCTNGWYGYYNHRGIDLVNLYERYGPIYAADTGTVETAAYGSIDGYYVVINHNNGYKTHYGHMSRITVSVGDTVTRGDQIGNIGMTGVATGPHVHFHFIVNGTLTNACSIMNCGSIPWDSTAWYRDFGR